MTMRVFCIINLGKKIDEREIWIFCIMREMWMNLKILYVSPWFNHEWNYFTSIISMEGPLLVSVHALIKGACLCLSKFIPFEQGQVVLYMKSHYQSRQTTCIQVSLFLKIPIQTSVSRVMQFDLVDIFFYTSDDCYSSIYCLWSKLWMYQSEGIPGKYTR